MIAELNIPLIVPFFVLFISFQELDFETKPVVEHHQELLMLPKEKVTADGDYSQVSISVD